MRAAGLGWRLGLDITSKRGRSGHTWTQTPEKHRHEISKPPTQRPRGAERTSSLRRDGQDQRGTRNCKKINAERFILVLYGTVNQRNEITNCKLCVCVCMAHTCTPTHTHIHTHFQDFGLWSAATILSLSRNSLLLLHPTVGAWWHADGVFFFFSPPFHSQSLLILHFPSPKNCLFLLVPPGFLPITSLTRKAHKEPRPPPKQLISKH